MRICILCEDSKLSQVREKLGKSNVLSIPVSESGMKPATHWFCTMVVSEEKANNLLAKKELTEMEITHPLDFLETRNLKMIR
jgi:hypothetical protein